MQGIGFRQGDARVATGLRSPLPSLPRASSTPAELNKSFDAIFSSFKWDAATTSIIRPDSRVPIVISAEPTVGLGVLASPRPKSVLPAFPRPSLQPPPQATTSAFSHAPSSAPVTPAKVPQASIFGPGPAALRPAPPRVEFPEPATKSPPPVLSPPPAFQTPKKPVAKAPKSPPSKSSPSIPLPVSFSAVYGALITSGKQIRRIVVEYSAAPADGSDLEASDPEVITRVFSAGPPPSSAMPQPQVVLHSDRNGGDAGKTPRGPAKSVGRRSAREPKLSAFEMALNGQNGHEQEEEDQDSFPSPPLATSSQNGNTKKRKRIEREEEDLGDDALDGSELLLRKPTPKKPKTAVAKKKSLVPPSKAELMAFMAKHKQKLDDAPKFLREVSANDQEPSLIFHMTDFFLCRRNRNTQPAKRPRVNWDKFCANLRIYASKQPAPVERASGKAVPKSKRQNCSQHALEELLAAELVDVGDTIQLWTSAASYRTALVYTDGQVVTEDGTLRKNLPAFYAYVTPSVNPRLGVSLTRRVVVHPKLKGAAGYPPGTGIPVRTLWEAYVHLETLPPKPVYLGRNKAKVAAKVGDDVWGQVAVVWPKLSTEIVDQPARYYSIMRLRIQQAFKGPGEKSEGSVEADDFVLDSSYEKPTPTKKSSREAPKETTTTTTKAKPPTPTVLPKPESQIGSLQLESSDFKSIFAPRQHTPKTTLTAKPTPIPKSEGSPPPLPKSPTPTTKPKPTPEFRKIRPKAEAEEAKSFGEDDDELEMPSQMFGIDHFASHSAKKLGPPALVNKLK